ncbi:hypothetical protein Tco_1278446 [Tanacetum coccineum]
MVCVFKHISLDFDNEDPAPSVVEGARAEGHVQEGLAHKIPPVETAATTKVVQEAVHKEVAATKSPINKRRKQMRHKRVNEETKANAPPKVLMKDHAFGPTHNIRRGKSLAVMGARGHGDPHRGCCHYLGEYPTVPGESKFGKINLLLPRRVTQRYLSVRVGRNQQLPLGIPGGVPRPGGPRSAARVTGKERIKAAFEEFKKSKDEKIEQRYTEMDARLDALSIDFDEELYPHMLTAIAGRRWVIGHGLRLAVTKCVKSKELRQAFANVVSAMIAMGMSEGLKYGVEHGKAKLDLTNIEAYDPKAETKYIAALTTLKDLKYPLVDHLEKLRDALIDLLIASLHLENDSGEDAPDWIRELRLSTSQLKIPIYLEVRDPRDPWVGSAHHVRSDGIPVSTPTVAPQVLAILLADSAVQTEASEDEASLRLHRSKSLPPTV